MKAIAIILIALVLVGGAAYLAALLTKTSGDIEGWFKTRKNRKALWELHEESDGELVLIYADKPDQERLLIGAVPFTSADFDSKLWELRAEGREKVTALNEGRKLLT